MNEQGKNTICVLKATSMCCHKVLKIPTRVMALPVWALGHDRGSLGRHGQRGLRSVLHCRQSLLHCFLTHLCACAYPHQTSHHNQTKRREKPANQNTMKFAKQNSIAKTQHSFHILPEIIKSILCHVTYDLQYSITYIVFQKEEN